MFLRLAVGAASVLLVAASCSGSGDSQGPSVDAGLTADGSLLPDAGASFDAGTPDGGPGDAGALSCPRYHESVDGACVPVEVSSVVSEELHFTRDGLQLEGTLVRPVTRGRYLAPGIVLVHGSGPADRDETTTGNLGFHYGRAIPTFRLLAEALARQGAAVLRYDKRNCFQENSGGRCQRPASSYPGSLDDLRYDDFVEDARAALLALGADPAVDEDDLVLIGHSDGANFVPRLLAEEGSLVGGVQLAGSSVPLDVNYVVQLRDFADYLEGINATLYANDIQQLRTQASDLELNLQAIRAGTFAGERFDGLTVDQWLSWMHSTDHLREQFVAAGKPMLLLNGEADFNVAPRHLEAFRSWGTEAGLTNAEYLLLADVTHSFVKMSASWGAVLADLSPEAVAAIASWHRRLSVP